MPISAHRGPILAALALTSEDLDRLLVLINPATSVPFVGADLSIANISALFRHKRVADALGISIEDWCTFIGLGLADPFKSPRALLDTIERIQQAQALPFDAPTLSYILQADRTSSAAPPELAIGVALDGLRTTLQQIDVATDPANLPTDHVNLASALAPALLTLDNDPSRPGRVLDVLEGRFVARVIIDPKPAAAINLDDDAVRALPFTAVDDDTDAAAPKLVFGFTGLMAPSEKTTLTDIAHIGPIAGDPAYLKAIEKLYLEARLSIRMISTRFTTSLVALPPGLSMPPALRSALSYDPVAKTLQFQGVMSDDQKKSLLSLSTDTAYQGAIAALYDAPRGDIPASNIWLTDAGPRALQFPAPFPAPKGTAADLEDRVTANLTKAISLILPNARLAASRDGVIAFGASVSGLDRDATASLLDGLSIAGASLMSIFTDRTNFVLRTGPVTASELKPAFQAYDLLVRSGLIAARQSLKKREVSFVLSMASACSFLGFSDLQLAFTGSAVNPASLDALIDQTSLLALDVKTRGKNERLLEFLITAKAQPATIDAARVGGFTEASLSWPSALVQPLVQAPGIGIKLPREFPGSTDILVAANWRRMSNSVIALRKLGLATADVFKLVAAAPDQTAASLARQAIRARFGAADFASAMKPVQTALRHMKRDALAAYLLHYTTPTTPSPPSGQWKTKGDLFAYYLIDAEVNASQMTSRIVQAASTVQICVQRAQMGLEPEISPYIALDPIWEQWSWMGAYRLWQANYEVFLFPENVLQPNFRRDKSDAFQDLENELQQNDINDNTVQDAFLNYLNRLDEVSNLDITGVHFEDGAGKGKGAVHVIGRTPGAEPHTYFYRKLKHPEDRWTAWQKINVDIKSAPAIPFIYDQRLFAVWPDLREKKPDTPDTVDVPAAGGKGVTTSSAKAGYQLGVALSGELQWQVVADVGVHRRHRERRAYRHTYRHIQAPARLVPYGSQASRPVWLLLLRLQGGYFRVSWMSRLPREDRHEDPSV